RYEARTGALPADARIHRYRPRTCGSGSLDAEAERPELLAAVFGDLVGAPRRHPDPVDLDVVDELAHERGAGLVLDHVGEGAGRAGERHVDHGDALGLLDAVHQAEVDDVDAQLRVDDVAHGLLEVLDRRLAALRGRLRHTYRTPNHGLLGFTHDSPPIGPERP